MKTRFHRMGALLCAVLIVLTMPGVLAKYATTKTHYFDLTIEGQQYVLVFDANGGVYEDGTRDKNLSQYDAEFDGAIGDAPVRDMYVFDDWATTANAAAADVTFPYTITAENKRETLYAVWNAKRGVGGNTAVPEEELKEALMDSGNLLDGMEINGYSVDGNDVEFVVNLSTGPDGLVIPLKELVSGKRYRVSFTFEGRRENGEGFQTDSGGHKVGYQLYSSKDAANSDLNGGTWNKLEPGPEYYECVFDATAETMYLVFNFTDMLDADTDIGGGEEHGPTKISIDNIEIEYAPDADTGASATVIYQEEEVASQTIAMSSMGSSVNFGEFYPADQNQQQPEIGKDYSMVFEPSEGYALPETITVTITSEAKSRATATTEYVVATDGSTNFDGYPTFVRHAENSNIGTLTIPGALLTEATREIAVVADAVPIVEASASIEPAVTVDPSASVEPGATVDPNASVEPAVTVDPNASVEPAVTVDPSASAEPTATIEASASIEPTATAEPTIEPTVEPTLKPIELDCSEMDEESLRWDPFVYREEVIERNQEVKIKIRALAGYLLPETITVTIDEEVFAVYTDGKDHRRLSEIFAKPIIPKFIVGDCDLLIQAEYLTDDTVSVKIEAKGVPEVVETEVPTAAPTADPTTAPTNEPAATSADVPTAAPTEQADAPATQSDATEAPATDTPTEVPASDAPTTEPTEIPATDAPTEVPSEPEAQSDETETLTDAPTEVPATDAPTAEPTEVPAEPEAQSVETENLTEMSTKVPATDAPTNEPTEVPATDAPTTEPTEVPATDAPTNEPTVAPAAETTAVPPVKETEEPEQESDSDPEEI